MRRTGLVRAITVGAALVAGLGMSGCAAGESCYDWVPFETYERGEALEQMSEEAVVVVVVTDAVPVGTERWSGVNANVWDVRIDSTVKGGVVEGEQLRVMSTPETCSSSATYPDGDPLDVSGPVRLYLSDDEGRLRTLTPFAGVEPAD